MRSVSASIASLCVRLRNSSSKMVHRVRHVICASRIYTTKGVILIAANKANFIITYDNSNQVYAAASEEVALATPPPAGSLITDKHVFFIMHEPDNEEIVWYKLDDKIVHNAEVKEAKRKPSKKKEDELDESETETV